MHTSTWRSALEASPAVSRAYMPLHNSSSSSRPHTTCGTPVQYQHKQRGWQLLLAAATDAAQATAAGATSTSNTGIQLRRLQQLHDRVLGSAADRPAQQKPEAPFSRQEGPQAGSERKKASGFGASSSSGSSSSSAQQQRVVVQPHEGCPCRSGLQYQACCQPFLSGQLHARSAPELARARITAALTGDVSYLVASTHPDSSLTLGGRRDLKRRTKGQAAALRERKPNVVGMAHCGGETDDTWYVLTIFQDKVGPNKGTKWPALYLMAKRGSSSNNGSNGGSSGSNGGWLYMGETNKLPQVQDAEALWSLLQLHVPELLNNTDDDSSSRDGSSSGGMTAAEVYFLWGTPPLGYAPAPGAAVAAAAAAKAGSSGGAGGWYLDLLQPAVERLQGGHSSCSSSSSKGGWGVGGGLISMDALLEGRQLTTVPAQPEQQR